MRLLFANNNSSPVYGGVERWMIDAASGLNARGHAAVLFGRPGSAWLGAAARAGIRVRGGIHGTWAARVVRVWAAMRAERPDVVIVKGQKLARMAALIQGGRQFSYDVARRMGRGEGTLAASMVKAYVCRAAEWVTREAMQLHGGMGYAEEFPVSRYFVDARVLSIFEGADETLCLRLIARRLTEQALG